MFFLAAQRRAGAGVVHCRARKTGPKPCLFGVLFVPFSCCFMPLSVCVWLMLHMGHPLRLSPLVRRPWSVVSRQSLVTAAHGPSIYIPPRCAGGSAGRNGFWGKRGFRVREAGKDFGFSARRATPALRAWAQLGQRARWKLRPVSFPQTSADVSMLPTRRTNHEPVLGRV